MHYVKHFDILGVDTRQIPCIELQGVPTTATEGAVGLLGINMLSAAHEMYVCTGVKGAVYTWTPLQGSGGGGADGVGISKSEINAYGELVLTYTNGNSVNLGKVVGENGENGKDGKDGVNGKDGIDGSNGKDGVSATHAWKGTVLTITSASGTSSADLKGEQGEQGIQGVQGERGLQGIQGERGEQGEPGENGKDGTRGTNWYVGNGHPNQYSTAMCMINDQYLDTLTGDLYVYGINGWESRNVSIKGATGATGADGYTPVKGVDYFTEADKEEIAKAVDLTPYTEAVQGLHDNLVDGNVIPERAYCDGQGNVIPNKYATKEEVGVDIPNYVVTEAESVITRVLEAQGNRTFTFATITDMHYGNGSYTDGVKHAVQAMKYIDERIKLDAVAVLGDYCDSYPAEQYADSIADFKAINKVLTDLRFAPNMRLQGNHDYYADHKLLNRRFIQSYSDNAVWGSKIGGYFYRDFEDFKLRVICVNTTETDNANIAVSTEQYEWFINSLDLTDKDDVAEWQILVLSHHPLDWYVADSVYRFAYILDAYRNGTSWSGGNVSCNFAGKNSAVLIGNIHGHIHNLLTGYLNKGNVVTLNPTEVLRMATPEACVGRANQYTGAWQDSETHSKTTGTANETSFCVYCIDLDTNTIKAICYGAGYDRMVNYSAGAVVKEYTISYNLTNVTSSSSVVSVQEGESFSTTLTAKAAMESVVVTIGGVDITATAYANGVVNIASVTGNVIITAIGAEEEVQIVNLLDTVGYTDGKRFSASNGAEKDEAGCMITGYIDVSGLEKDNANAIYAWGVDFNNGNNDGKCVWVTYDANKTVLGQGYINPPYSNQQGMSVYIEGDSIAFRTTYGVESACKYIRFSGVGSGANAVVTFNQPPTVVSPTYTNLLPISIGTDGEVYNGKGYKVDTRLNSSGAETSVTGINVTGFIPLGGISGTIYLKNVKCGVADTYKDYTYIRLYDDEFNHLNGCKIHEIVTTSTYSYLFTNYTQGSDGYLSSIKFELLNDFPGKNVTYFRISSVGIDENAIITVNEPID